MLKNIKIGMELLANRVTALAGSVWSCMGATLLIVLWGLCGPWYHYSDTWQLIANTFTTLITFVMVFLIQNTQNRESKALHLKMDELILSRRQADNAMIGIETLTEDELNRLAARYQAIADGLHRSSSGCRRDISDPGVETR